MAGPIPEAWAPHLRSALRMVAGFLFMAHGTQKLFGAPAAGPRDPVELLSLLGVAGVLETFGGLLLVLGLFTRPVAFLLSGRWRWPTSCATSRRALADSQPWRTLRALLLPVPVLRGQGGGPWSLDALRRGRQAA
jgi:putative oxidoreductase